MPVPTLAVIDGHYFAYRFFFGMPPLTGPGGRPTGVLFAFAKLFKALREDSAISHWALVLDTPAPSFRHLEFPAYKAHRDPMPDPLREQIAQLPALATAHGIPLIAVDGFEADDVLYTFGRQAPASGLDVRLLTRDKDVDQVLSEQVRTWDPGKRELRGPAELMTEKGIRPDQVVDYLCMVGDTADNVPGIDGVGPKTAAKLLAEHGTLAAVLANVDQLKGKQAEKVRAFIPLEPLTRRLISLVEVPDLPLLPTLAINPGFAIDGDHLAALGFNRASFVPVTTKSATPASPPYRILGSSDLPALVVSLHAAKRFAVDTETTGLDPLADDLVGISLAWGEADGYGAVYLPVRGLDHELIPLATLIAQLGPVLADPALGKVGQNSKFDARILARAGLPVTGYDGDTMLASWLLEPAREGHGLDLLTRTFLGEEKIRTGQVVDLAAGQTMAQVAVTTVATYACEDAQCTWRLAQILEGKLAADGLLRVYREQEVPIAGVLAALEQAGIGVDPSVLSASQRHLESYLTQVQADIRRLAGVDFNPNSPKQIAELLFTKLKLPVISETKSGPSTDASVLEALRHHHELPDLLLQHRSLSKLIGTYLARLPEHISRVDGRIHSNFKQTGTETGRLSSDQPNMQNIPKKSDLGREIRAAFVAAPGCVLVAADYSQIELRILAHLSGDATLRAAFAADADIHRYVAAKVYGIDEASVTPRQRNAAKAVNFGVIYGQTAFGLSQQLGIERSEAQRFIDDYFARFFQVKGYVAQVVEAATATGYATTMAGRRRAVPQLASGNRNERLHGQRIALNTTIQGSAADLIKQAMLRCRGLLPAGSRLILQIHDELLVEADEANAEAAAQALTTAMTGAWVLDVPLLAQARIGRTWLEVG